jgi:cytochrome c biogenesis protein
VEFLDRDSGKSHKMTLPFRETKMIPGTRDQVEIVEYQQDLSRFGPALGIVLQKEGERESSGSWVLVKVPEFHGNRIKNYQIKVIEMKDAQYTGLQVKRDPGIWTVYFGFTAMLVGIGLTFYTSHRKLWIWAGPEKAASRIVIAGRSSKNAFAFEQDFNKLCERLQEQLKSDEKRRKART